MPNDPPDPYPALSSPTSKTTVSPSPPCAPPKTTSPPYTSRSHFSASTDHDSHVGRSSDQIAIDHSTRDVGHSCRPRESIALACAAPSERSSTPIDSACVISLAGFSNRLQTWGTWTVPSKQSRVQRHSGLVVFRTRQTSCQKVEPFVKETRLQRFAYSLGIGDHSCTNE